MLGRRTKLVMLIIHLKSSKQSIMVRVYSMQIDVLGLNTMRHHLITGNLCIPLTNTRKTIDDDNGCQGTMVQSNKCE